MPPPPDDEDAFSGEPAAGLGRVEAAPEDAGAEGAAGAAGKFRQDVVWNLASLAVLAASGIALLALIARWYDEATLGVFQQVYAVYIFFSQAAVGGIDRSALRAVAAHPAGDHRVGERARAAAIVAGALAPTALLGAAFAGAFWLAREPLSRWLQSPGVAEGMAAAAPGLACFAVNKVLLAVVNALRRMRAFAVYQSLRYVLILVGLYVARALDLPGSQVAFVFTFSEGLLLLVLAVEVGSQLARPEPGAWRPWSRIHLRYGLKSMVSGMLLELQARVDVLMLGYYLADARVGIYAFAVQLAEGVFQVLVALQNNYNPLLARRLARGERAGLEAMVRSGKRKVYLGMVAAAALAVACFPLARMVLTDKPGFEESWVPFAILMAGIAALSGYYPFSQVLLMGGHPGWHTLLMVSVVLCNVVLNALLIPRFDIAGAALGTALSFVWTVVALRVLARARLGVRL